MTGPIELRYVLDVTHADGMTERFWSLTRHEAYELADEFRLRGSTCIARDDDYGYALDLDPATRSP